MKLRNKKTDEVWNVWSIYDDHNTIILKYYSNDRNVNLRYYSLAELNEDWEDYKPTEPLIKDEKIRKAVRAWAEANGARRAYIVDLGMLRDESTGNEIKFNGEPFVGWVTALKTITELCGEEEE